MVLSKAILMKFICPSTELAWVGTQGWLSTFSYFEVRNSRQSPLSCTLLCTRYRSCFLDFHINLTYKSMAGWFGQDFESCKQSFLGKFQLKTAQIFVNCDLWDRLPPQMGPTFLNSLSNFLFRTIVKTMLGRVIWPGFWIFQTKFFRQISTQNCMLLWMSENVDGRFDL